MSIAAARRPTSSVSPATRALPVRHHTHFRDGLLWICVGVGGLGITALVGYPRLAVVSLVAGVVLGLFTVVVGELKRRRHRLHDQVVEAVGPLMGTRALDRRTVTLARWTLGAGDSWASLSSL